MSHCPHCGGDIERQAKPRSSEQLRRYFALLKAAFHHWPERHAHQFANVEECRAFLQMKAGHREIGAQIPLTGMSKERAMLLAEAAIRGAGSYAMPVIHGDVLVIFRPRSVSFAKMAHHDFCRLSDMVESVLQAETGLTADQLLTERAA